MGEVLSVIVFKQKFQKVEDTVKVAILEKVVTKNNQLFLSYVS